MLWFIFAALLGLWLLSMALSFTMGGLAHLLLVGAVAVILVRSLNGKSQQL